jgi:hypothetical protein
MSTSTAKSKAAIINELNRTSPSARDAQMGQLLADLISGFNALVTDYNTRNSTTFPLITDLGAR